MAEVDLRQGPPSRQWDRQSLSEVRNLIIEASEFIGVRLRLQQLLKSLVYHVDNGQWPDIYTNLMVSDPELVDEEFYAFLSRHANRFAGTLKEEYIRSIEEVTRDFAAARVTARQVIGGMEMEGREDGMGLQLYNSFCRAAERQAQPQRRRRRERKILPRD